VRRPDLRWAAVGIAAVLTWGAVAVADDMGQSAEIEVARRQSAWDLIDDPVIRKLHALDQIAPFEDKAPLWDYRDRTLQLELEARMQELGLQDAVRRGKLAVALVDITELDEPRVASLNGDRMMYAASLPKIAVLLGAFEKIAQGKMKLDRDTERHLKQMIRVSSNASATEMMHRVGKEYIARVLLSPRYRLYDPERNGGLWVGKDFAKTGLWRRDPLHHLSHGATAMQVARFYYLLETGNLVTPEASARMKAILNGTGLEHKFVKALRKINPAARLFRKSGSWRTYHSDSVMVKRGGRGYIAVALSDDRDGARWMREIIVALDGMIFTRS